MKPHPIALIIDDERAIRRLLRMVLETWHYKVWDAATGQSGLEEAVARRPDVIILDLGLPDMDGLEVLKRLREWNQTPVLILSVRDDEADKVAALDSGANDYVTKPFGTAELLARLRVLQRCVAGLPDEPVCIAGNLKVDLAGRRVAINGRRVELTATEEALLQVLARHAGSVITCQHLVQCVWGAGAGNQLHSLRVYIARLRKKLAADDGKILIQTEGHLGYRLLTNFEAQPRLVAAP